MQFARVAHATDFLYCYSIIEANRRVDYGSKAGQHGKPGLPRSSSSFVGPIGVGQTMHTELNTFFPFDPYRLPRSSSYIQNVYREWSSVAIDDDEDEEEEDDSDDEEEEGEEDAGVVSEASDKPEDSETLLVGAIPVGAPRLDTRQSETDGLGASFGGMSISPARPSLSVSVTMPMSVS